MKHGRPLSRALAMAGILLVSTFGAFAQNAGDASTGNSSPPSVSTPPPLSPVIWTENPDVVQRFAVDAGAVRDMFNRGLLKLTSAPDAGTAWTRLGITPRDVVGIKITTIGGQLCATHRPLIQAICDGLQAAGVSPSQIIIWDKDGVEMRNAGYAETPATDTHVGIASVFPGTGYDPDVLYKGHVMGTLIWGDAEFVRHDDDLMHAVQDAVKNKGYSDDGLGGGSSSPSTTTDAFSVGSTAPQTSDHSHYAKLVTTICTKIINVPVLTDNAGIGVEGCMGSLALGSVDNNRRFVGDPSYGDPAICEILSNPVLRRKVVLHVLDALIAQYAGGPHFDPQFTKPIGALYLSRDPVAIDSLVLKRIEHWREDDRNGRIDPIGKTSDYIHSAPSYNLGTDDPHRIQLIKVP